MTEEQSKLPLMVLRPLPEPRTEPAKAGRPSSYDPEVAAKVCEHIGEGMLVHEICKLDGMPGATTIYRWIGAHADFEKMYEAALMARFDLYCEELKSIAKGQPVDAIATIEGASLEGEADQGDDEKEEGTTKNGEKVTLRRAVKIESIQRSRTRIETIQWIMKKRLPKVYGEPEQIVIQSAPAVPAEPFKPNLHLIEEYRKHRAQAS